MLLKLLKILSFFSLKSCSLFYFDRSFYVHSEKQQQHFTSSSATEPKVQAKWIKLYIVLLVCNNLDLKLMDHLTLFLLD